MKDTPLTSAQRMQLLYVLNNVLHHLNVHCYVILQQPQHSQLTCESVFQHLRQMKTQDLIISSDHMLYD